MTNVLIVDDQYLAQEMMARYLETASDRYLLVDRIKSADEAMSICEMKQIDLILMDICTADRASGLKAAEKIKARFPGTKIIIVTSMPEFRFMDLAKHAGIESFWYKDVNHTDLLTVMDQTMAGESVYPEAAPTVKVGNAVSTDFTPREREVLYWIVEGSTLPAIAEKLNISETTVRYHLENMRERTGCKTKLELAILAVETGLVLPHYG